MFYKISIKLNEKNYHSTQKIKLMLKGKDT